MSAEAQNPIDDGARWVFGILSVILALIYLALEMSLIYVVPAFSDLFSSFGAKLPKITRFILENRFLVGISLLILYLTQMVYLVVGYGKAQTSRAKKTIYIQFIVFIAIGVALVIALIKILYLPVLNM